jgi:hypothetical protein
MIEPNAVRKLYSKIPEANFSHDVLAKSPDNLMVMRVAGVDWSDLGEPTRVLSTLARFGMRTELTLSAS